MHSFALYSTYRQQLRKVADIILMDLNKTGLYFLKTVTQTKTKTNCCHHYFDGHKEYNCSTSLENGGQTEKQKQ